MAPELVILFELLHEDTIFLVRSELGKPPDDVLEVFLSPIAAEQRVANEEMHGELSKICEKGEYCHILFRSLGGCEDMVNLLAEKALLVSAPWSMLIVSSDPVLQGTATAIFTEH